MSTFAGYIRVSRVGDRAETLRSPEDQRKSIERWAKSTGNTVEILRAELDRSGADDQRPVLLDAIGRVERGELAGIVVYRLDRFARTLASSTRFIERVEAAGGEVISATESFNGDGGNLLRNITLSIGQDERDRRAADFERSKASAIERGVYVGKAPIGYAKGEDRRLVPDERAPVVRGAFERRAGGESWRSIADWMAERLDRGMLPASVRAMIQNPAYMGIARQGKHRKIDAHPAIVDRSLWEAAQIDHPRPARGKHGTGLLAGLLRCSGCSRRMTSTVGPKGRYYRCGKRSAGGKCPAPASVGAYIEPYVTAAVFAHLRTGQVSYVQRTDALSAAQGALDAAEQRRDGLHRAMDIADVGAEHFAAAMGDAVADVERCRRELAEAHLSAAPLPNPVAVADVLEELDVDELRHVLRGSLGVVWVSKGRGDLSRRVRIVARGFEPADLSVRGVPSGPPATVDLPEGDLDGEIRAPSA